MLSVYVSRGVDLHHFRNVIGFQKMASGREERNYSSPPKRLKLDDSAISCTSNIEIDKVTVSASFKSTETSVEGKLTEKNGNTYLLFGLNMATFQEIWLSTCPFLLLHF